VAVTAQTIVGIPSPPTTLTAIAGNGYVLLNWTAPTAVGGSPITFYKVYRGISASGESSIPIANLSAAIFAYNDSAVTNQVPYYYVVKAVNTNGTSNPSNEVLTTPINPGLPSAPKNVLATPGAGKIVVTWDAPDSAGTSPITGYSIYRSDNGSQLSLLTTTSANTTAYTDSAVVPGHSYGYQVVAKNANGNGSVSATVSAIPNPAAAASNSDNTALYAGIGIVAIIVIILAALLLMRRKKPMASAPVGLTAMTSAGKIQLNWSTPTNVGGGITEYRIYRGTKAGAEGTTPIGTVPGAARTFTDQTVMAGTSYYYVVKAVNSAGEGVASNEVSATADKS
jgi:fibronectin type 3 domain-containing protein